MRSCISDGSELIPDDLSELIGSCMYMLMDA